jgi:hypothetical protein
MDAMRPKGKSGLVNASHRTLPGHASFSAVRQILDFLMVFRSGLYLAAVIDSTWIVLVLASSAPTTVTFCPANFSGACWSLSV